MQRWQWIVCNRHGLRCGNGLRRLALLAAMLLIAALAGPAGAAGPSLEECAGAGIEHPKQLVAFVATLQEAVRAGDKAAVVAMMEDEYPVEFSGNGKDVQITSAADFLKRYDDIMTKQMREQLSGLTGDDISCFREGAFLSSDDDKRMFATQGIDGKFTYYFRP